MAQINRTSVFDRKNYFYADLPQGYQISQYAHPIVGQGRDHPRPARRLDAHRSASPACIWSRMPASRSTTSIRTQTYIDLNRSGVALMEIVSEPDLRGPEDAAAYLRKLRAILRYLGTCDGNMEEGSMRCERQHLECARSATTGSAPAARSRMSTRSARSSRRSSYEARRQVELLENGGTVVQETRLWDPNQGLTRSMRGKEEAHDYRYFPDPDLLPLVLEDEFIDRLRAELPELPDEKKLRFINHYGLSVYDATVLIAERERADFYERVVGGGPDGSRDPKVCANWVITELFGALNKGGHDIDESPITADQLGGLIDLLADETISGRIAKDVFAEMYETGKDAAAIVEEKGLRQVNDTGAIDTVIDEVLAEQADKVAEYRGGKDKLFGFFVGQVMKKTQGKANPKLVNDALRAKLDGLTGPPVGTDRSAPLAGPPTSMP